jgi:U3 small nucleolar RNA-associated protein 5
VQALNTRLTENPRRTNQLLPWIRALLTCHAAYLSTLPSALKLLAPLQQIAEERIVAIPALLRLQGRLELLLGQASIREKQQALNAVSGALMTEESLAVYDESEDDEEAENAEEAELSDESEMEMDDFEDEEEEEEEEEEDEDSDDEKDSDEMDEDDY